MAKWRIYAAAWLATTASAASAIDIVVDYRYDTSNFFPSGSEQRATLEAVAQRYSDIITTSLRSVTVSNNSTDQRIGFTHPGNGQTFEVSPATSTSNDAIYSAGGAAASEYRGSWSISTNDWILYAGGRSLSSAGVGGTGTGTNFTNVFEDDNSVLNRGFRNGSEFGDLPVWGGTISFDSGEDWHFGLDTAAPTGELDFYTIAMHEVGHALGLSSTWNDWADQQNSSSSFAGDNAVDAYNADNNASRTSLNLAGSTNPHWQDGAYDARIFAAGDPHLAGTEGLFALQDLLMEPTANFTGSIRRLELTTVDVAALEDVGWDVIDNVEPALPGDYDFDGDVDAADYAVWRENLGTPDAIGSYSEWSSNYGATSTSSTSGAVPEPAAWALAAVAAGCSAGRRRR